VSYFTFSPSNGGTRGVSTSAYRGLSCAVFSAGDRSVLELFLVRIDAFERAGSMPSSVIALLKNLNPRANGVQSS